MPDRLHPLDIEAVARRVVELLADAEPGAAGLVDVRTLARALGVSADFVYGHARELGGVKLTDSPKSPWRFDIQRARDAIKARGNAGEPARAPGRRRRRAKASVGGVELLPVRGLEP